MDSNNKKSMIGIAFAAFALVFGFAAEAMAELKCTWRANPPVTDNKVVAEEGQVVHVMASCLGYDGGPQGSLESPADLGAAYTRFGPVDRAQGGFDATFTAKAGTHKFTAKVGNETASKDFTFEVKPKWVAPDPSGGDYVPRAEFAPVRDDVETLKSTAFGKGGRLQVGVAGIFSPNNGYVTQPTGGLMFVAGGQPVMNDAGWARLQLDVVGTIGWTGAPINPDTRPTSMSSRLTIWSIAPRVGAALVPSEYIHILAAVEAGVLTESWSQHVIRQRADKTVEESEEMDKTRGYAAPQVELSILLGRYVAAYGNAAAVIPFAEAPYMVALNEESAYVRFRGGLGLKAWLY